jgi:hypothetical protein
LSEGGLLGGRRVILLPTISVLMLISGLLAIVGPARRALRIQPIEGFSEE